MRVTSSKFSMWANNTRLGSREKGVLSILSALSRWFRHFRGRRRAVAETGRSKRNSIDPKIARTENASFYCTWLQLLCSLPTFALLLLLLFRYHHLQASRESGIRSITPAATFPTWTSPSPFTCGDAPCTTSSTWSSPPSSSPVYVSSASLSRPVTERKSPLVNRPNQHLCPKCRVQHCLCFPLFIRNSSLS